MRFNIRLHGKTTSGQKCLADVSVYVRSSKDLQKQAQAAAENAVWLAKEPPHDPIPEGAQITVEHVETV